MKKILIVIASLFVLFLGAAIAIPLIFKDDIKAAIDKEMAKSIDADVYFDADEFNISFFSDFPNLTVSMGNFGIIGRHEFQDNVLMAVKQLEVSLNVKDLIFGDDISIGAVKLDRPQVFIKILEDGKANYDIVIAEEETTEQAVADSVASDLAIQIDHWEISDGHIQYDDKSLSFFMDLVGLNHQGSGDFTLSLFDMDTKTTVENAFVRFDGIEYLVNKNIDLDMLLNMDLDAMKFSFKENTLKVNDFALGFDGWFAMTEEDYNMDISFNTKDNDIKSLYSLVPGVFKEGFDKIESAGNLAFDGIVKGTYNNKELPSINFALKVANGMIHYPSLPKAIQDINVDVLFDSPVGEMAQSSLAINQFEMDFGGNPVDMKAVIKNFDKPEVDATINAKLDLAEVNTLVPTEGLQMKGAYAIDLEAKGVYDSLAQKFPNVSAHMTLADGYFKYDEYPIPLEKVNLKTAVENQGGKMENTTIEVTDFNMLLDGDAFSGSMVLQNLVDYHWDTQLKGKLDLEKITRIFPLDSMEIKGVIDANIQSKGDLNAIEQEDYQSIKTSGNLSVANFEYKSQDLPHEMTVNQATATFNPEYINLTSFDGKLGNSDMKFNGKITNYMNYIFKDNAIIKGNLNYQADLLDVNQWMVSEGEVSEDTSSYETEIVEIPKNIDFVLAASIDKVLYDNMDLKNVAGQLIVKDGKIDMKGINFNTLGGSFAVNGSYDTRDLSKPTFDFGLDMENVSIQQSYTTFNSVKAFAPIAKFVNGNFSTKFNFNGELGKDMMPKLGTISGSGLINVVQAVLEQNKITNGLAGLTGYEKIKTNALVKDLLLQTEIKDGRLNVKPYEVELGGFKTKISGGTKLDGEMDFDLLIDVPAGDYGAKLNGLVSNITGKENNTETIKLPIKLTQQFSNPKFALGSTISKGEIKDQLVGTAKTKLVEQLSDNKGKILKDSSVANLVDSAAIKAKQQELKAKQDSLKALAEAKAKAKQDSLKKVAEEAKKKASDKIKSLLKFNDQ